MLPALLMMWMVSKIVHHSSPCCSKNVERFYCLPQKDGEIAEHREHDFLELNEARKIDPLGQEWIDKDVFGRYYHHVDSEQDLSDATPDSTMDREDPAIQMIPAEYVNTENEIIVLSGNERENEDFLTAAGEAEDPSRKYDY